MMTQNLVSKKINKKKINSSYGEFYMKMEMKSMWGSGRGFSGGGRTDPVEPEAYKKDSMDISLKRHCEIV